MIGYKSNRVVDSQTNCGYEGLLQHSNVGVQCLEIFIDISHSMFHADMIIMRLKVNFTHFDTAKTC